MNMFAKAAGAALVMALGATNAAAQSEDSNYILATASTGGTYYPVGVALSTLVKVRLQPDTGIGMSAINSAGSGENVRLLREGEAQFGILQGLYGYYARTGTGPLEQSGAQENLRSVTMLWQNVEHFVVGNNYVDSGTVSDLTQMTGESMAFGQRNSGTIGSNAALLDGLGINIREDYDLVFAGYGPSAEALQNGQVAGLGIPAGVPVGAISQLFASAGDSVTLLTVTEDQMAQMDGERNLWTRFTIEGGTYPTISDSVDTIAQPNFLATDESVSEDDVYQITKTIYENLPFLQSIHPATNAMALEQAIQGLPLPLHPGAARFYEEQGIDIPDRLIASQ